MMVQLDVKIVGYPIWIKVDSASREDVYHAQIVVEEALKTLLRQVSEKR